MELNFTKASASDDSLQELLDKVIAAGGKIISDDEYPLFAEFGRKEVPIGKERTIEFNINKTDYQITRQVENYRIAEHSHEKGGEKLDSPRITIKLKNKPETSNNWVIVDFDELF